MLLLWGQAEMLLIISALLRVRCYIRGLMYKIIICGLIISEKCVIIGKVDA